MHSIVGWLVGLGYCAADVGSTPALRCLSVQQQAPIVALIEIFL